MNHYLETSGEKPALNWLLSDQSKIGNYSDDRSEWESYWQDGKDRQDYAIEPGTSGELSFYVVPHNDGNVTLRCNLGVIPYKVDESGNYNEIMDTNVCNFLQGHILFFLKYLDENNTESIAWIKDGSFQLNLVSVQANEKYEYTLYWCWPQTFAEMILETGDSFLNGKDSFLSGYTNGETVRAEILTGSTSPSLVKKPDNYFYSFLTQTPLPADKDELNYIDQIYTNRSSHLNGMGQETAKAFVNLSSYYNQADQFIGNSVDCLRICLTAEPEIGE